MHKIDFRYRARQHLKWSKKFAETNEEASLRAACLELRMCIESLVYDTLQSYLNEVANTAMEKWQPKAVMKELLDVDPTADKTSSIAVGKEEVYGQPAKVMQGLGTDKRFSIKWADKAFNSLGNYLHEPTISQHKAGQIGSTEILESILSETMKTLEEILASPIWNANFGVYLDFLCECGFNIKRKEEFLRTGKELRCRSCGMIYDYSLDSEINKWRFSPAGYSYKCLNENCKAECHILAHKANTKDEYVCEVCGDRAKMVEVMTMKRVVSEAV